MRPTRTWTEERIEFLKTLSNYSTTKAYDVFNSKYPNVTTLQGLKAERWKLGIQNKELKDKHKHNLPLYSETEKKGYTFIKIANNPNVWISKQKWLYMEYHPEEYNDIEESDMFIFLDGDKSNFSIDNIGRLKAHEKLPFARMGGVIQGNAELTRIRILQIRLRHKQLDIGALCGIVKTCRNGRFFIDEMNEKIREKNRIFRKRHPDKVKEYRRNYWIKNKDRLNEKRRIKRNEKRIEN